MAKDYVRVRTTDTEYITRLPSSSDDFLNHTCFMVSPQKGCREAPGSQYCHDSLSLSPALFLRELDGCNKVACAA